MRSGLAAADQARGQIALRVGPITSAVSQVTINLSGTGGHTSRPHLTQDIVGALGTLATALIYVGNPDGSITNVGLRMFGAVVIGLVLAQVASRLTEYFTSTETAPVREIAEVKMRDRNAVDLDGAIKQVEGPARSMGIEVVA